MTSSIFHGGDLKAVKRSHPEVMQTWIDLSTGLNPTPYPWQERVAPAALERAAATLPQEEQTEACVKAWTKYLNVSAPREWKLTSGSQAIINILPILFPKHQVLIPEPSYGEHERVWRSSHIAPILLPRTEMGGIELSENQIVILTSPNNPDGYIWPTDQIRSLSKELATKGGYLVVDEAFSDVSPATSMASEPLPENLLLLRSFGKFFGLAGLRLGLARIPCHLEEKVQALLGPWAVNGPGTAIATQALGDTKWIEQMRCKLPVTSRKLRSLLENIDCRFVGGTNLFCLVEHADTDALVRKLNRNAIHVRRFEKYPSWIRFGLPADGHSFQRLKETLDD